MSNNTINTIKEAYLKAYNEQKQVKKNIEEQAEKARAAALRYQRIAAQKMGEYHKLCSSSCRAVTIHWTNDLVLPILRELDKRTGLNFSEGEENALHCFGLRCECPVFAYDENNDTIASLVFTPGADGTVYIDSGETNGNFHPNSIAAMNGLQNVTEEVTSIKVIIDNLCRRDPELAERIKNR